VVDIADEDVVSEGGEGGGDGRTKSFCIFQYYFSYLIFIYLNVETGLLISGYHFTDKTHGGGCVFYQK
jgi:hypothetical protein